MAKLSNYRVSPTVDLKLGGREPVSLQVNCRKNPNCENFGVPAKETHGKPGPSDDRDKHYIVTNTAKGRIPAILCKSCKEKIPIKSNAGIAAEFSRISELALMPTEKLACKSSGCENFGKTVGAHPDLYHKAGFQNGGKEQMYRCKCCKSRITESDPVRLHKKTRHLASDFFSRVVNKSPVRGIMRGLDLTSAENYYDMLNFITRRCQRLSGSIDRRMIEGQLKLPEQLNLSVDIQEYQLNWTNKHDKRNTVFSTICSVDQDTGYIFGMAANYDKEADAFEINKQAALNGDTLRPEAFREYAQYWLSCDEFLAGRSLGQKLGYDKTQDILQQITDIYARAQSREDIENREDQSFDTTYCNPVLAKGMQVHVPYTSYAHFQLMQQLTKGAGVKQLQYSMDCDSMLRAGFLSAFHQEVKNGQAHGFYVRYTKYLSTPQRTKRYLQAQDALDSFRASLPANQRSEAEKLLMKSRIKDASPIGKWKDKWLMHPIPSMNQPDKAICWLTERDDHGLDDDTVADMHLKIGINAVDNIFQISRRLMNAFERPIGTSSGYNTVWHGYSPYNPRMVEQYLSLLRTYHNFIKVGNDKKTPAMRLGLTKLSLTFDDILWPGQRIPKAPRKRRKGLVV